MLAAQYEGPSHIELIDYQLKSPGNDELLIEVESCGVCGTDFHIFSGESYAAEKVILGHEYCGTVVQTGKDVSGFSIGDKIAVDPNIYCGKCYYCRKGQIQFCENLRALGVTLNGGFAEYSIVPVKQAYKLPHDFELIKASFSEPLSCCIHGIDQADIKPGNSVTIIGAGTIGLLMMQLAKTAGAFLVIVIEPVESKRNLALKLGADHALSPNDENLITNIKDISFDGVDIAIECAGNSKAVELAAGLLKRGGTLVVFGLSGKTAKITLSLDDLFKKELTIKNSFLNPFTFSRAVDMLTSGKINVDVLNPSKVPLKHLPEIFTGKRNSEIAKYLIINHREAL